MRQIHRFAPAQTESLVNVEFSLLLGARERGRTLRRDVFLPSKHLLSAFYKTLSSKNPSKNLVFTENLTRHFLRNPSKKHLLVKNLLRTLLRGVLLHDPLAVHPNYRCRLGALPSQQEEYMCIIFFEDLK